MRAIEGDEANMTAVALMGIAPRPQPQGYNGLGWHAVVVLALLLACGPLLATAVAAPTAVTAAVKSAEKPSVKPVVKPVVKPANDWCQPIANRLHSLSLENCRQSGLVPSGAYSVQGFPILRRTIPPQKKANKAPTKVLLLGGIHGDELTSVAIVFKWLQWMHMAPAQNFHWSVAPVVNPDGFLITKPQRINANGVDLNRNFPTPHWHDEAPQYWVKRTGRDPRRYPGEKPLSEPESRWVHDEIARFNPDVVISVHAPFGVLDFDGPARPPQQFGRLFLVPVGVYPGSLGNYSGMHKKVPIITIELPNAMSMPSEAESRKIWQDMLTWIQHNVSAKSPVKSTVTAPIKREAKTSSQLSAQKNSLPQR